MEDEAADCPLCLEQMDLTDRHINFCQCGYRMCLWCWHQIMENAAKDNRPGRCPACRNPYDEKRITMSQVDPEQCVAPHSPAPFPPGAGGGGVPAGGDRGPLTLTLSPRPAPAPASASRRLKIEEEKKKREKSKSKNRNRHNGDGMDRRALQNTRVIQRNLVYVIGIPMKLCREETLKRTDYFGRYGKIVKVSVNRNGVYSSNNQGGGPTGSAYVTFARNEDAVKSIQKLDGTTMDGHSIRACFGTTKYCNAFLRYQECTNPDCLYLHEIGMHTDSFTKEEMLARYGSKHQNFHELTHPLAMRAAGGSQHGAPAQNGRNGHHTSSHRNGDDSQAAGPSMQLHIAPLVNAAMAAPAHGEQQQQQSGC